MELFTDWQQWQAFSSLLRRSYRTEMMGLADAACKFYNDICHTPIIMNVLLEQYHRLCPIPRHRPLLPRVEHPLLRSLSLT